MKRIAIGLTLLLLAPAALAKPGEDPATWSFPNHTADAEVGDWVVYDHGTQREVWVVEDVADDRILVRTQQVLETAWIVLPRSDEATLPYRVLDAITSWGLRQRPGDPRVKPYEPLEAEEALEYRCRGRAGRHTFEWEFKDKQAAAKSGRSRSSKTELTLDAEVPILGMRELVIEVEQVDLAKARRGKLVYKEQELVHWTLVSHGDASTPPPEPGINHPKHAPQLDENPFGQLQDGARAVFEVVTSSRRPIMLDKNLEDARRKVAVTVEFQDDRRFLRFEVIEGEPAMTKSLLVPSDADLASRPFYYLNFLGRSDSGSHEVRLANRPHGGVSAMGEVKIRSRVSSCRATVDGESVAAGLAKLDMKLGGGEIKVEGVFTSASPVGFTKLKRHQDNGIRNSWNKTTWKLIEVYRPAEGARSPGSEAPDSDPPGSSR